MNRLLCIIGALSIVHAATIQGTNFRCPHNCFCTLASEAGCNTLQLSEFGLEIFTLKINDAQDLKLSREVFKNLRLESLNNLYIHNSTITELDEDAFKGLTGLTKISIQNSVLPEVPQKLFEPLPALRLVDMSNNKLNNFAGIHSSKLHELDLSGCEIRNFEHTCVNCARLSYLNLANNLIEHVPTNFFTDSLNLEHLNLSHNLIKNVEFQINSDNNNLVSIDLSYNPIEKITGNVSDVEDLFMKHCGLTSLDFLAEFTFIVNADLSDNELTSLDKHVFDNLSDLKTLDLSNNKLNGIDGALFKNNNRLSKLTLSRNNLGTLPEFVTNDVVLKLNYFECDDCGLTSLPETVFKYAPSLLTISLKSNKLKEIPKKLFQYVPSLVKVDLANNSLTHIETETFRRNPDLKNVILSGTLLTSIDPVVFSSNRVLKHLDVSLCNLKKLWSSTGTKIPSLTALNAGFNNITTVSVDELEVTKNLEMLDLESNALDCSQFSDMHKWLINNNVLTYKMSEQLTSDVSLVDSQTTWLTVCDYVTEIDYSTDYSMDDDSDDASNDLNQETDDDITLNIKNPEQMSDDDDDDFKEDVETVWSMEPRLGKQETQHEIVVFLLPTLVFVLTALIVLVVTVSAILCILYKRNKKPNSPQINIIPWSSTPKIKKHSGSVYRPLSEEKIPV